MCIKLILVPCMTTNKLTVQASISLISRCTHTITGPFITSFVNAVCRTGIGTSMSISSRDAIYQNINFLCICLTANYNSNKIY